MNYINNPLYIGKMLYRFMFIGNDGLVSRKYTSVPPKVEYYVSEFGKP